MFLFRHAQDRTILTHPPASVFESLIIGGLNLNLAGAIGVGNQSFLRNTGMCLKQHLQLLDSATVSKKLQSQLLESAMFLDSRSAC